ncbi:Uma2 family endonuclease [Oscillatoria sp. FACHB-1406]|uniref:Uma2 family endonuclease n=1 Tax=Oscillatoria sp. FACHB-1406 TaxID=2692846 RepID=UPI001682893D|nr:Uma2 family endonuclease [Oscillatoria sp. FACHB-1406]MBD2579464.1 Uma2 family endonuclease [Oscillatoria sp. FACHB-1406]
MTVTQELTPIQEIQEDVIFPKGDIESDEPPLESDLHLQQIILLIKCLEWLWQDRNDFYVAGNLSIYYSPNQRKSEDVRGPDFFVVLGTERKPRKSWVVWQEDGQYPNVIIEILSAKTAKVDRGLKKTLYQNIFRTPDYLWFDPYTLELAGFHLLDGEYQPLTANPSGHLWSKQLGLNLGILDGKLRFFTAEGEIVPTVEEVALRERERSEQILQEARQATQRAEEAVKRADRLAAKLRELNIDPDSLD